MELLGYVVTRKVPIFSVVCDEERKDEVVCLVLLDSAWIKSDHWKCSYEGSQKSQTNRL